MRHPSRSGFTLTELLVVIAIIGILMGVIGVGITQARRNAKRAKAEAELRSLVTAWSQWFQTFGNDNPNKQYQWPQNGTVEMTSDTLAPIVGGNSKGIVLLNVTLPAGKPYLDPWKNPYEVTFESPDDHAREDTFKVTGSISLQNGDMQ